MGSSDRDRALQRLEENYKDRKEFLVYDDGKYIEAKDCADGWNKVNQFLFSGVQLKLYRVGNRHIVPRITINIQKWENLIPMDIFGYSPEKRLARLRRNYLNLESLHACRSFMDRRDPGHHSTHGISFGTSKKKTPACMVGGTFHWAPGRLLCDFYFRASEVTKTLGADFHFLNSVIFGDLSNGVMAAVPDWMNENLGSVRLHLNMGYAQAQWFPLFDVIQPGYPLNLEHRFHRMCQDSINKARGLNGYESKWRSERRVHNTYRQRIRKLKTNREGRVVSGPTFFPCPKG